MVISFFMKPDFLHIHTTWTNKGGVIQDARDRKYISVRKPEGEFRLADLDVEGRIKLELKGIGLDNVYSINFTKDQN
jgi:hypothetical protein